MNYFELYNLPVSFNPDQNLVKQKFYELSKKYHPDFHINESEEKQQEVLALSTQNNKAFQVLKNEQLRLQYILTLFGQLIEGENYQLPQSFLMEMMDVNEALMELEFDADAAKREGLTKDISAIEAQLTNEFSSLTAQFDSASTAEQQPILAAIKDLYYRNKYLLRLKESLGKV
jgi:molecular chaperone HscB